jgi:hypothetical protein
LGIFFAEARTDALAEGAFSAVRPDNGVLGLDAPGAAASDFRLASFSATIDAEAALTGTTFPFAEISSVFFDADARTERFTLFVGLALRSAADLGLLCRLLRAELTDFPGICAFFLFVNFSAQEF